MEQFPSEFSSSTFRRMYEVKKSADEKELLQSARQKCVDVLLARASSQSHFTVPFEQDVVPQSVEIQLRNELRDRGFSNISIVQQHVSRPVLHFGYGM